jgi:hypothetical protein
MGLGGSGGGEGVGVWGGVDGTAVGVVVGLGGGGEGEAVGDIDVGLLCSLELVTVGAGVMGGC